MKRRKFCQLVISAAASAATLPAVAGRGSKGHGKVFNPAPTQDYAAFCATPAAQRVYYRYQGQKVYSKAFGAKHWRDTGMVRAKNIAGTKYWKEATFDGVPMQSPIPGLHGSGPYLPTWDSLLQYECPEWYQDAKFGIWNHWSPQCVPEMGDWYARNMYVQGTADYRYELEHYGPQSRFGYKDLCAQWTMLNWQPADLMARYKRAGAKLFMALANHHDGFDTWNSKHHEWNAVRIGPHRDVLGTYAAEARRHGLRFGVSVHKARNWVWFQVAHGADKTGPYAGVPYDGHMTKQDGRHAWWRGLDPQQLYAPHHPPGVYPDPSFLKYYYDCARDLIDQHDPDLLYFDDTLLPYGWCGMNVGAYFYNHNLKTRHGKMEAVINVKQVHAHLAKAVVADIERGMTDGITRYPWQSETCIGDWHYKRQLYDHPGEYGGYLHPRQVIHWMIDAVSKNGTFILNIPGKPDGTIDRKESLILDRLGDWFAANGEAIYATRPWKIFGEGPNLQLNTAGVHYVARLGVQDIRFTRNKAGTVVYALVLGWPEKPFVVKALGTAAATKPGKVQHVSLLGTDHKVVWKQTPAGLHVQVPAHKQAVDYALVLKVHVAQQATGPAPTNAAAPMGAPSQPDT